MTDPFASTGPRFAVFRSWVGAQQARAAASGKKRDQFSDTTARIYASLWRGWLQWLSSHQRDWTQATQADVTAFLAGPAPAPDDRRTRVPIEAKKMARYTQQRYWRVLQAVYAHAVLNGLVASSPLTGIANKPRMTARTQTRQLLPAGVLGLLREPIELERFLPMEHESQWWVLRDRAAVALAAHCGLAPAELIALRGADLRHATRMLTAGRKQLQGLEASPSWVDVPARAGRPARSIQLPQRCLPTVEAWLLRREELLGRQAQALTLNGGQRAPTTFDAPVLLSREAPQGRVLPSLDAPTLYHCFQKCLALAIAEAGHVPEAGYVARGPSILRNTVIADWARQVGPDTAAQLAGLKPASLRTPGGATPSIAARA